MTKRRFIPQRRIASVLICVGSLLILTSTPALARSQTVAHVIKTDATPAPPLVESESFEKVGSINATLLASYDPEGPGAPGPAFLASTYYFEYGIEAGSPTSYEFKTTEASVAEETGKVAATAALNELKPATEYHFRLVAVDANGTTYGENEKFTTFTALGSGLPDGRIYEMVTPPENENADVYAPSGPIAYEYSDCGCNGVIGSHRPFGVAPDGNAVIYVGDASFGGTGSIGPMEGNQYLALHTPAGWVQHNVTPAPNGGLRGPEYEAFSADLSVGVVMAESHAEEHLSPEAPLGYPDIYRRVLSGFDYEPLSTEVPRGVVERHGFNFAGASTDFSHILYTGDAGLLPEASESGGLYEWVDGRLSLVNVVKGEMVWPAEFGYGGDFSNVISADGSHVFWTDSVNGDLYAQKNGSTSILIAEGGEFWSANSDGSEVFYTKDGDLYEFNVETEQTTDIASKGEVEGLMGTSENGEYVYFVADAVLAAGATAEQPNLYLRHGGETKFIATLSFGDDNRRSSVTSTPFVGGDWARNLGTRTAEVSPDGRAIVFESVNKLTEYNNEGAKEIYIYEAQSGEMLCASCKPTGEAPSGGEPWLAVGGEENPTLSGRSMSDDGTRVFFDTSVALVPRDTDGLVNVYEWERDGAGTCQERKGCIYIISSGNSEEPSFVIGTSATGNDAFFETRSQLTPQDNNEAVNMFDAAVSSKPPVAPECSGTSCQGVPFPPTEFEAPSTVTFAGVGNFPPGTEKNESEPAAPKKCKKGYASKKGKCVKEKRAKKGKRRAKKLKKAKRARVGRGREEG